METSRSSPPGKLYFRPPPRANILVVCEPLQGRATPAHPSCRLIAALPPPVLHASETATPTQRRWRRSQNPQRLSALSSSASKVTNLTLLLLGLSESSCRPPQSATPGPVKLVGTLYLSHGWTGGF
ncbi:hypothetical protein ACLB2K_076668 [Fragaria x ananassa]